MNFMKYNNIMNVIRKILPLFIPILFSFFLISCEDVFHNVSAVLEDISINSEKKDPRRIFIGGNFSYNSVGSANNREALAVLGGQGNYDYSFFQTESTENGIGGTTESSTGVRSIEILNDYIYVAGDFEYYDSTLDDTITLAAYRNIVRYNLDGTLSSYTPASSMGAGDIVYDIAPISDGSLFAGGSFTEGLIKIEPDGTIVTTNTPTLTATSEVYSLYTDGPDYDALFLGGNFSDYTAITGFSSGGTFDSVAFLIPGATTTPAASIKIKDIDISSYGVLMAGIFGGNGILVKYNYDGTFVLDTDFLAKIALYPFSAKNVNTVAVSNNGFIYLGGNFTSIVDSNTVTHNNLIRLYTNGELDSTFDFSPAGEVYAIEIQANGSILVGGAFSSVNMENFTHSEPTNGYFRIRENGEFDSNFNRFGIPGMSAGSVYSFAIQEESN